MNVGSDIERGLPEAGRDPGDWLPDEELAMEDWTAVADKSAWEVRSQGKLLGFLWPRGGLWYPIIRHQEDGDLVFPGYDDVDDAVEALCDFMNSGWGPDEWETRREALLRHAGEEPEPATAPEAGSPARVGRQWWTVSDRIRLRGKRDA